MAEMGRLAVWVALVAGVAAVASRRRLALTVAVGGVLLATAVLARALVGNDYSLVYVADFSRRGASAPYRLAALWGGMAGSLLWFATLAGAAGWWAVRRVRAPSAQGVMVAVTGGLVAALAGLVLAFADPFRRLEVPAIDGGGLTPILEHPTMLYHPPLLYLGLATLTGPFALTVAGLAGRADQADRADGADRTDQTSLAEQSGHTLGQGRSDQADRAPDRADAVDRTDQVGQATQAAEALSRTDGVDQAPDWADRADLGGRGPDRAPGEPGAWWTAQVRRWLLVPWTLLAAGMLAGSHWAYVELGWGGYWAWDPVENTALLPWLALTLALHSTVATPHRRRDPALLGDTGPGSESVLALVGGTGAAPHLQPTPKAALPSGAAEPRRHLPALVAGDHGDSRAGAPGVGQGAMVCVAFLLALTGTMLTRSGAVSSVHAFAESRAIGRALGALVVVVTGGVAVLLWRALRSAAPAAAGGRGLVGRLLAGHLVVVGTVLGVATIGTLAPLVTDLRGGDGIAVEGRYFASFAGPLAAAGLVLVALVPFGLRPATAGRTAPRPDGIDIGDSRTPAADQAHPTSVASIDDDTPAAGWAVPQRDGSAPPAGGGRLRARLGDATAAARLELGVAGVGVALGVLAVRTAGGDVDWRVAVLAGTAGAALLSAVTGGLRARRSGGRVAVHVAHAGIGLLLLGVAGTASGTTETVPVAVGDDVEVRGETVEYRGVEVVEDVANGGGRVEGASAVVADVRAAGRELRPSLVAYPAIARVVAETSLVSTPWRDVQVGLRDAADDGRAVLQIGVHPLQVLVWWGALVLVLAGIIRAVERRRTTPDPPTEVEATTHPHGQLSPQARAADRGRGNNAPPRSATASGSQAPHPPANCS